MISEGSAGVAYMKRVPLLIPSGNERWSTMIIISRFALVALRMLMIYVVTCTFAGIQFPDHKYDS